MQKFFIISIFSNMRFVYEDIKFEIEIMFMVGKLHRRIVQLQISEGTAVRKVEDSNKKIVRLEAQLLQREHKLDDKDQTIYHNRLESRSKAKYLKHTIQASMLILEF